MNLSFPSLRLWKLLFLAITLAPAINHTSGAAVPRAVKGILDLRGISNPGKFIVKLNGEWEFYWEKMLRPEDFGSDSIRPAYYGNVPSYWTEYHSSSLSTGKFGFATYRLRVLLPQGLKGPLAFDMPVFDSSYDIYIDGKYLGSNGKPGKSEKETIPQYRRNFFRIVPESDTLDIIIDVANFHHRRGGFWLPVKMGTFPEVQRQLANSWAAEWSVITILLGVCGLLPILLYYLPKG